MGLSPGCSSPSRAAVPGPADAAWELSRPMSLSSGRPALSRATAPVPAEAAWTLWLSMGSSPGCPGPSRTVVALVPAEPVGVSSRSTARSPSRLSASRTAAPASVQATWTLARSMDFSPSHRSRSSAARMSSGGGVDRASPVRSRSAVAASRSRRRSRSVSRSSRSLRSCSSSRAISSPRSRSMSGGNGWSAASRAFRASMASASASAWRRWSRRARAATAVSIRRSRSGRSASRRCSSAYSRSTRRRSLPALASPPASCRANLGVIPILGWLRSKLPCSSRHRRSASALSFASSSSSRCSTDRRNSPIRSAPGSAGGGTISPFRRQTIWLPLRLTCQRASPLASSASRDSAGGSEARLARR